MSKWLWWLLLSLAPMSAHATAFLPPICVNKNNQGIECPKFGGRDREFGTHAKSSLAHALKDVAHGKSVVNMRNDRYLMFGQPMWIAPPYVKDPSPGDLIGTCIVEVHYFDFENYKFRDSLRYVHSEVSQRACKNEEARLRTGKLIEPFPELQGKRVFCNSLDVRACSGAAYQITELARRPAEELLADKEIVVFGIPAGRHLQRQRVLFRLTMELGGAKDMYIDIEYGDPGAGYDSWCASSSGWRVCKSREPDQTLIFPSPLPSY